MDKNEVKFYQIANDVDIYDIIVPENFKSVIPRPSKIANCIQYYKYNFKIDKPIIINPNKEIVDGYIRLLVCRMFEIFDAEILYELG